MKCTLARDDWSVSFSSSTPDICTNRTFVCATRYREMIWPGNFLEDVDCADLALDELQLNPDRTDAVIARVVAMRIAQP